MHLISKRGAMAYELPVITQALDTYYFPAGADVVRKRQRFC